MEQQQAKRDNIRIHIPILVLLDDKNAPNSYVYDLGLLSFASFKPIIAPPSRWRA
jgi:hypothetical protein